MVRLTTIGLDAKTYKQLLACRKRLNVSMSRIVRSAIALWDGETLEPDDCVRVYCTDGHHTVKGQLKGKEAKKVNKLLRTIEKARHPCG